MVRTGLCKIPMEMKLLSQQNITSRYTCPTSSDHACAFLAKFKSSKFIYSHAHTEDVASYNNKQYRAVWYTGIRRLLTVHRTSVLVFRKSSNADENKVVTSTFISHFWQMCVKKLVDSGIASSHT